MEEVVDEAQEAIIKKTQRLKEAKKKLEELKVTFVAERDEQVAVVRMKFELDKLWDIEALSKNFDKVWYCEREEWTA